MSKEKITLPTDLSKASDEVKALVALGAMRNYVKNFYKYGQNKLINLYGLDKRENGHIYFANIVFSSFIGDENTRYYLGMDKSRYMYFNFKTLAYYCHFIQGLYNHLVDYKKCNPTALNQSFEQLVVSYGYYYKSKRKYFDITPNFNMTKKSLNDKAIALYTNYHAISPKMVQDEFDKSLVKEFKVDSINNLPFALDVNYMDNNFTNNIYNSRYKVEMLEDLIDYCSNVEQKMMTKDFETFYNHAIKMLNKEMKSYNEHQNVVNFDEDYLIPDETM